MGWAMMTRSRLVERMWRRVCVTMGRILFPRRRGISTSLFLEMMLWGRRAMDGIIVMLVRNGLKVSRVGVSWRVMNVGRRRLFRKGGLRRLRRMSKGGIFGRIGWRRVMVGNGGRIFSSVG